MQFSLWMVEEALQSYVVERHFSGRISRTIENIRLYNRQIERRDDTLYVEHSNVIFQDGDESIVCVHRNSFLRVRTATVTLVFNQILQFFEETREWEELLNDRITSGCLLRDVLNHFHDVLPLPLMVLDNGQIMLAHSEAFGRDTIDEEWNEALETGSFHIGKLAEYNRLYHEFIRNRGNYVIPSGPFPYASFNRNIYIDNEFVGFISLILIEEIREVYEDWFDLACTAILSWVKLYMRQNAIVLRQEALAELLEGHEEHLKQFSDAMYTVGWNREDSKRILVVNCLSDVLNMNQHIARVLGQNTTTFYAIEHQNQIVAIFKESLLVSGEFAASVQPILKKSGYYGGLSNPFTDYGSLQHFYRQARIALEHCVPRPGHVQSIQDHLLAFLLETVQTSANMELRHPAVLLLAEYDRIHRTDLLHVLEVFLKHFCSQSETARALFLHRSSVIRKLDRIVQLTGIDFDDYETRLHLMISFALM